MSNYDDQVLKAWDAWVGETGEAAGNPDDFIVWALEKKLLAPTPIDMHKIFRRRVSTALRRAVRVNSKGISYRAKQCAIMVENGQQIPMYFDTDTGGTPNLRKKAAHQRREAIANDVYRAVCDIEHMNEHHKESIQFVLNFEDDCADRRAADTLNDDIDDAA
jgi:hypothetical protein